MLDKSKAANNLKKVMILTKIDKDSCGKIAGCKGNVSYLPGCGSSSTLPHSEQLLKLIYNFLYIPVEVLR